MEYFSIKRRQNIRKHFLWNFPPSSVIVIGRFIVHPSAEGTGVDRMLMNAAITPAHK